MPSLTVAGIIQNGFLTGLKNAASLLGAVVLWGLTLWIPYLNVGTTIGLLGLIAAMSKGEVISPTVIFRPEYRKQMGEFFLVQAFISVGVAIGLMFFVVPGVVIAMAWGLAPLLVIDQGVNPTEALQKSNDLTSGKKLTIFFGMLLAVAGVIAAVVLLSTLAGKLHAVLGALFFLAGMVLVISVAMGAQAHVYGVLTGQAPEAAAPMNDGAIIGGAIGGIVVAFGLSALVASLGGRPEPEPYRYRSAYEEPARSKVYDGLNPEDPPLPAKKTAYVAPSKPAPAAKKRK